MHQPQTRDPEARGNEPLRRLRHRVFFRNTVLMLPVPGSAFVQMFGRNGRVKAVHPQQYLFLQGLIRLGFHLESPKRHDQRDRDFF